ncbi:MAG: hypothetical protein C0404_14440, partial [Verrucomicrobia bacterium]|nr:hypothetical protein [Verrucomicrobiota bacterium]
MAFLRGLCYCPQQFSFVTWILFVVDSAEVAMKKRFPAHLAIALVSIIVAQGQTPRQAEAPKKTETAKAQGPWTINLSMDSLYSGYSPAFSRSARPSDEELKYSRQANFMSMSDIQMDSQVKPIIDKANETAEKNKDFRKATEYYRRIIQEFPEDLYQIAPEGIFVPASLYAQLKVLAYPPKELAYYRMIFDPAAKEIFERAVKRYSIFDYKDIARVHLATSYGDDALFALGNAAIDNGNYDEARRYYEQLLAYCGLKDDDSDEIKLDRDQIWVRLAICYKYLGRDRDFQEAISKVANKNEPTVAKLMTQLEKFKFNEFEVRQREGRRSPRYDALDDKSLFPPMPYTFSANRGEWTISTPAARRGLEVEPEALPWATEADLIYKNMNILFSRSLLTGDINWSFGPGGSTFDWDRSPAGWKSRTFFDPVQSILVHDGVVFASMFVYGPSLVAVDQYTGQQLWAKGPMAAQTEDEWLDRYQASPAAGRGMVVAGITHDDIRGRTHISSSAELAAFESRTGKLLWRTTLARISPLKITQSRYPRKIRILTTPPAVKDGVVYHVTNAGSIAAVDAQTGTVIWMTRYPQSKEVLDNFSALGFVWRNEPPVIRGNMLYVTPVDCPYLLCMDKETGKIIWTATHNADSNWNSSDGRKMGKYGHCVRMNGFTPDGLLLLAGNDMAFLNPENGTLVWTLGQAKGLQPAITGEGSDFWADPGNVHGLPVRTTDSKVYFSRQSWHGDPYPNQGPFNSEYCLDLKSRSLTAQRRWYHPPAFIFDHQHAPPVVKRVVNEEPEAFDPVQRMTFTRWRTPFEVDVSYSKIVVRYDKVRLEKELSERKDLEVLFGKAEIARKRGDVSEAISLYESCKN